MKSVFHLLTLLGALIAGYLLVDATLANANAMQQTADATMAIAWVVIPYCFARAVEQLTGR